MATIIGQLTIDVSAEIEGDFFHTYVDSKYVGTQSISEIIAQTNEDPNVRKIVEQIKREGYDPKAFEGYDLPVDQWDADDWQAFRDREQWKREREAETATLCDCPDCGDPTPTETVDDAARAHLFHRQTDDAPDDVQRIVEQIKAANRVQAQNDYDDECAAVIDRMTNEARVTK